MSRLEELLRMRAKQGELNHLSMVGDAAGFDIIFKTTTRDVVRAVGKDPVAALIMALEGREAGPLPRRTKPKPDAPKPRRNDLDDL